MWSIYTKSFTFRNCFEEDMVQDNVRAINQLLKAKQADGNCGTCIIAGALSSGIVNDLTAYKTEDGTWEFNFYMNDSPFVANVSLWDAKEIQMCFEIEENIENHAIKIHGCEVKTFKEYQV